MMRGVRERGSERVEKIKRNKTNRHCPTGCGKCSYKAP